MARKGQEMQDKYKRRKEGQKSTKGARKDIKVQNEIKRTEKVRKGQERTRKHKGDKKG